MIRQKASARSDYSLVIDLLLAGDALLLQAALIGGASMTRAQRLCCSLIAVMLLGGCEPSDESQPSGTPPVEARPLDEMTGAMDKARAVQDTTLQHKEDLDRALRENEGAN